MTFEVSFGLLLSNTRTSIQISKNGPLSFVDVDLFLFYNILLCMLLAELKPNLFLQTFDLTLKLCHSRNILTSKDNFFHEDGWFSVLGEVESRDAVWQMEVESKRCMFAFIVLDDALENADVEWHMLSIDGKQDGVSLVVDVDKTRLQVFWKFFLAPVAFNFAAFDGLLLFVVVIEVLVASFLKFLQLLLLEDSLMLISLLLIFEFFVGRILDFSPSSLNNVTVCWWSLWFALFLLILFLLQGI